MIKKLLMIFLWTVVPTVFAQSLSNEATESNQPVQGQVYILESDFCRNLSFRLPDHLTNGFSFEVRENNRSEDGNYFSPPFYDSDVQQSFTLGFSTPLSYYDHSIEIACIENPESPILNGEGWVFFNEETQQWEIDKQDIQEINDQSVKNYEAGESPVLEEIMNEEVFQISIKNGNGWLLSFEFGGFKSHLIYVDFCLFDANSKGVWCGSFADTMVSASDFYLELLPIVKSMEFVD